MFIHVIASISKNCKQFVSLSKEKKRLPAFPSDVRFCVSWKFCFETLSSLAKASLVLFSIAFYFFILLLFFTRSKSSNRKQCEFNLHGFISKFQKYKQKSCHLLIEFKQAAWQEKKCKITALNSMIILLNTKISHKYM